MSMVHGDRESPAVCKSTLIRLPARTLTETIMPNQADLEEAYHAAAKAAGRTRDGHATFRIEDRYSGFGSGKAEHVGNRDPTVLIHNMAALKAMVTG